MPADLRGLPLFLEAFGRGSWLVRRERIEGGGIEAAIHSVLEDPAIDDVLIRNAEAGCFIARVELWRRPKATPGTPASAY